MSGSEGEEDEDEGMSGGSSDDDMGSSGEEDEEGDEVRLVPVKCADEVAGVCKKRRASMVLYNRLHTPACTPRFCIASTRAHENQHLQPFQSVVRASTAPSF